MTTTAFIHQTTCFCDRCVQHTSHHHAPMKQSVICHALVMLPLLACFGLAMWNKLFWGLGLFAIPFFLIYLAMVRAGIKRRRGHFACDHCGTMTQL